MKLICCFLRKTSRAGILFFFQLIAESSAREIIFAFLQTDLSLFHKAAEIIDARRLFCCVTRLSDKQKQALIETTSNLM